MGVGASAGGLEALSELFRHLPRDTGMAFVIVQHLLASSKSLLASLIARTTEMPVADVRGRIPPERNHVYVVPPNATLVLVKGELCLLPRVPADHHPIDRFFRSLAEECQVTAVGVVVSGTGSDGTLGLQAIHDHGGITFAQDEPSAKFPEMPRSAAAAGCVDLVLPPAEIARELAFIGRHPYVQMRDRIRARDGQPWPAADMNRLLLLLRNAVGIDFTAYKSTTVRRRILRRMALRGLTDLGRYVGVLRQHPEEISALADDFLIGVTGFFRDPEAFGVLTRRVFPQLLKRRSSRSPVRIWVPGCSTGEEVYSISICLFECLGDRLAEIPIKIFGTDLKDTSIAKARAGVYTSAQLEPVSSDLLYRYFVKVPGPGDRYRVRQDLRDACIFATHNLLKDPPYSRLDLISCRNVLIYLEPLFRSRVIPMFHHALKPSGVLMLGESESIGAYGDLFAAMDKKHRIFSRGHHPDSTRGVRAESTRMIVTPPDVTEDTTQPPGQDTYRKADRLFAKGRYRAGVLVNEHLQILRSYGATQAYLRRGTGRTSLGLLRAARKELQPFLTAVVHRAARTSSPVGWERIGFRDATGEREVSIKTLPLVGEFERHYVILFRDHPAAPLSGRRRPATDAQLVRLTRQLAVMREQVRALIEEDESAKEELQSATEEIQSSNEQLQSANQELEHAKEELQSTNEELTGVNEELKDRNQALDRAGMDLQNLLSSLNLPIVMVDRDLRLRRFTPTARQVLNVIASDVGRPITDIRWTVDLPDVEQFIRRTVNAGSVEIRDVQAAGGRWYSVSIRPYETPEGKIDGAVIAMVDVSAFKREAKDSELTAEALRNQQADAERRVEQSIAQLTIATALAAAVEAELDLHQAVTQALAEAPSVAAATPRILETVCQRTGWARAELWMAHPTTTALQCDGGWSQPSGDTAGPAARAGAGGAAAQQVWRTGEAIWIADSTTPTSAGQPTGAGTPWHAVGAFPIRKVDRLIGVLVLCDREIRERDEPFARKMERLGRHLGVLFDRKRIEEALQTREEEYRLLSARLLGLQDEERRRLALDLHDSTAQRLAALTMNLDLLTPETKALNVRSRKALAESRALAEQCAREIRTLAYLLHPPLLDEMGLASAVRWYVAGFVERSGIQVTLDLGEVGRLSGPVETALFRIVQESLTNIHRHAQSPTASIRLTSETDAVVLEVHDQGRGLRHELKQANGTLMPGQMGVGIQGMRERVRQLGGTFEVAFTDQGTTVHVRVPLNEDAP